MVGCDKLHRRKVFEQLNFQSYRLSRVRQALQCFFFCQLHTERSPVLVFRRLSGTTRSFRCCLRIATDGGAQTRVEGYVSARRGRSLGDPPGLLRGSSDVSGVIVRARVAVPRKFSDGRRRLGTHSSRPQGLWTAKGRLARVSRLARLHYGRVRPPRLPAFAEGFHIPGFPVDVFRLPYGCIPYGGFRVL